MSQTSRPERPISGPALLRTMQAFVLFVSGVLGGSVGVSLWASVAPGLGVAAGTTAYDILNTLAQFVGFAAPVVLFIAAAGDRELLSWKLPDRRGAAVALGAAAVLYVLQIVLLTAFSLIDVSPSQNPATDPAGREAAYFLLMIPVSVFVVGPAEELLVRGGIQGLLKRAWGPWPAILGASALFGSLHYIGSGSGAIAYVVFSFLLGSLLGYLYERTGNLVVPMVAHGVYNAVIYAIQYVTFG
ncbi:CPBP family intramembrane metalloprotease [Halolamina litorea]|uniref:CPBP family intramembrane glutamic endopeptidase n=1 Tax=Halolamina litorea TaxID=1515593 RepID=A0ABD6BM31_9EURY|nr:type II CAAX endopeptidase family protein [Halolamina litorea]